MKSEEKDTVVLIVDTQGDFMFKHGALPVQGAEDLIGPMTAYISRLDPQKVGAVVTTFDTHTPESFIGSPENVGDPAKGQPGFPIHCDKGTAGWENVLNLRIPHRLGIPVYSLEKHVFDTWAGRDVEVERMFAEGPAVDRDDFFEWLKANGMKKVIVFGVASDFCVKDAIRGLVDRGFEIEVVGDLTAGILRDMKTTVADEFPHGVRIV